MIVGLPADGIPAAWEKDFAAYTPAGVILFRRDFEDLEGLRRLTARLRRLARPRRLFVSVDEEGGFVSQLAGHLVVPPNAALLARGVRDGDVEWIARVTGERLRALGIDWDFAPVADIHSEPSNPVIGPRAWGRTPAEVARHAGEMLRGFRAAGLAGCLKHFPGHGDTSTDSHHTLPVCEADLSTLEDRELAPFRENLAAAPAVMTAHVLYPALDPAQPGTFSPAIARTLLRTRLGFTGIAITDALEMKGVAAGREPWETARLALEAGCDLMLFAFFDEGLRRARLELARALAEGAIDRAGFDAAAPRLAAFDRAHPEPTPEELARPLESLTPPEWEPRLERIIERGLVIRGHLPAAAATGRWRVAEPAFSHGPTLSDELRESGLQVTDDDDPAAAVEVVAVMSRLPLAEEKLERIRATARARPTAVIGLQNDAFLDDLPEAALRISASDATPLTRRVVARVIESMSERSTNA